MVHDTHTRRSWWRYVRALRMHFGQLVVIFLQNIADLHQVKSTEDDQQSLTVAHDISIVIINTVLLVIC